MRGSEVTQTNQQPPRKRSPLASARTGFNIFVVLTVAILIGLTDNLDRVGMVAVQSFATPQLTELVHSLNHIGSAPVIYGMAAVIAAALLLLGHRPMAINLVLLMGAAFLANAFVKMFIARPRPIPVFGEAPSSFSFPSGHALLAACFFGFIGMLITARIRNSWVRVLLLSPFIALIAGIGLARVYQGVHYPSDVIGGFALAMMLLLTFGPRDLDNKWPA